MLNNKLKKKSEKYNIRLSQSPITKSKVSDFKTKCAFCVINNFYPKKKKIENNNNIV